MILSQLVLSNYRRFEQFHIDFHPELTVIAARNGEGKTTILEAIATALGPFVGAFDLGRAEHIRRTDARYGSLDDGRTNEQNFPVVVGAILSEPAIIEWERRLRGAKGRTTVKEAAPLTQWGKELQERIRYDAQVDLPALRYYSSKRLWVSHKNVGTKSILTQSRSAGYEDCLSSLSSFAQLQQWFKKATLAEQQQREIPGYDKLRLTPRLEGVRKAVGTLMDAEGWRYFHYSHVFDELAMVHPDHGPLPLSLLSDGVRAVISLAADLALRCVRLNPHLGADAPLKSRGIVLIDEVDLHLHPAWQQTVLHALRTAFPCIQFIVSTHSPQVLSTARSDHIRVVYRDAEQQWQARTPVQETLGLESGVALSEVMGVDPVPATDQAKWIKNYIAIIEQGLHDSTEGLALRDKLLETYGKGHWVLRDAERLIRFQDFKLRRQSRIGDAGDA